MNQRLPRLMLLGLALAFAAFVVFAFSDHRTEDPAQPEMGSHLPLPVSEANDSLVSFDASSGRTSIPGESPSDESFIRGKVVDSSGRSIPGAEVALIQVEAFDGIGLERSYLAQQAGSFAPCRSSGEFRLLPPAHEREWRILARADGFAWKRSRPLRRGEEAQLQLARLVELRGRLVDSNKQAVESGSIRLSSAKGMLDDLPGLQSSNQDGEFILMAPGEGSYRLEVRSSAGPDTLLEPLEVKAGMAPLEIELDGKVDLTVRVLSETGDFLSRVRVELQPTKKSLSGSRVAWTDKEGWASFRSLPSGRYWLVAEAENRIRMRQGYRRQDGAPMDTLEFVLPVAANVTIHVLDKEGNSVPGFEVLRQSRNRARVRDEAPNQMLTNDSGRCNWVGLFPGEYLFLGGGGQQQSQRREEALDAEAEAKPLLNQSNLRATLQSGENPELQLVLNAHALPQLNFYHPTLSLEGGLAEFWPLRAGSKTHPLSSGKVDSNGVAEMSPIPPGRYRLLFQLPSENGSQTCWIQGVQVSESDKRIQIDLPSSWIEGHVSHEGNPVQAEVYPGTGGNSLASLSTDKGNSFRFEFLSAGTYSVYLHSLGKLPWESPSLSLDGRAGVHLGSIALESAASLGGVVKGLPPMKRNSFNIRFIQVFDSTGELLHTASLDDGGAFQFEGLRPGTAKIQVQTGKKVVFEKNVQLRAGGREYLEVLLGS